MSDTVPKLFQPIKVGNITLGHRLVFAPLTRQRADKAHVPHDFVTEYYAQRASEPGTLLVSEATFIAQRAGGYTNVPGIWNEEQIAAWKKITDAIHAKGSFIYLQLWAIGRAAVPDVLHTEDPSLPYVSSSDVQHSGRPIPPRPLTTAEIKEYVQLYVTAATNGVDLAGFDGVEVHCAHGYLIDQFTQDVSNKRTDEYGGSIENRTRFALEIIDAVTKAVGQERTGFRLSPFSDFNDMHMADPYTTFTYLVERVVERFPNMAFLSLVEPRASGPESRDPLNGESNDFLRKIWLPRPLITAGGYTRDQAIEQCEKTGELIGIGRYWISNPDIPQRFKKNIPLRPYDRSTFYTAESPEGYVDYPFADESEYNKR